MKITTFPKITENPFKKYEENDFSLNTLINQTWKKSPFKRKDEAFIYIKGGDLFTLIPFGRPGIHRNKKTANGIYNMTPLRPTLDYCPSENKAELLSFQGVSAFSEMTEFVAVPDDIMINMIRYVLSQDFIERQRYTMEIPFEETLILDGGSCIDEFIIGKHHSEESNLEIFYDPKQKGFVLSVWKEDEKYPSFIYAAIESYENDIIYLEKKEKESYNLCNGGCVLSSSKLSQNVSYGPIMDGKNFLGMSSIPLNIQKRLDSINNYFQAKNLERLAVDDEIKIPNKNEIENILKIGEKLKYRFHNYKG